MIRAFTTWLAGGGAKSGVHYRETDEVGHKAAVDKVSVNDLHAAILALLGLDHEKLTYWFNGRIPQSRDQPIRPFDKLRTFSRLRAGGGRWTVAGHVVAPVIS